MTKAQCPIGFWALGISPSFRNSRLSPPLALSSFRQMLVRDLPIADTAGAVSEPEIEPVKLTGHPDHFAARHIGPDA
ncbi:MAG: hypothetical protein VCB81_02615, partial [Verrucomicrobiia bacterium]